MVKRRRLLGWNIFRKTQELEEMITCFLLNIIQAGVLYAQAMNAYQKEGVQEEYTALRKKVSALEAENDSYRRSVENDLYAHMILPDMRSDILRLLEGCDKIINKYESNLLILSVERPIVIAQMDDHLMKMIQTDLECVGSLISGVKAFFEGKDVTEYTNRTYQLEHQVDKQALNLKIQVFKDFSISLAHQLQLKAFIYSIEKISDIAEDVADILKIMAVKHTL